MPCSEAQGPHQVSDVFRGDAHGDYLIVLNFSLPWSTPNHWAKARLVVCADGGGNRLYDELPAIVGGADAGAVRRRYVPDVIIGDLDSLRPEVREFYVAQGAVVQDCSHDQDTTDLMKSLSLAEDRAGDEAPQSRFVAVGALGGRLDHELQNLSTLYMFRHLDVALVGVHSVVRLLRRGRNIINPAQGIEGPMCGIIPLNGPVRGSSKGLKYELDDTLMQVGGLVSTSNEVAGRRGAGGEVEVIVDLDNECVWTTELHRAAPAGTEP